MSGSSKRTRRGGKSSVRDGQESLFLTMSELPEPSNSNGSGSSPAAFPARALRTPARALASAILRLRCGPSSLESWASFDRGTWRSRTSQLFADSTAEPFGERFLGTWPRWGMTWRGDAFELPTWEPRMDGTGSSPSPVLPTPMARDGRSDGSPNIPSKNGSGTSLMKTLPTLLPTPHGMAKEGQARRPGPTGNELGRARALTLLPTPAAGLHNLDEDPAQFEARRARLKAKGINGNGAGTPLAIAVKLLPTPTANMEHRRDQVNPAAVRRFHDPKKQNELTGALGSLSSGASTSPPSDDGKRSTAPRPRLSPEFVEWMMGTPSCNECGRGWTDSACQHSVTAFTSTSAGSSGTRS
jgi:hypothetical protein